MYFGWQGSTKIKLLTAFVALFVINGLILINSRGSFLGALGAFTYFLVAMIFSKYKLPKQRIFIILIIISSIVVAIRLVDNTFLERMSTIETQSSPDSEGSGGRRINFWMATFDLLRDHPLGTGIYGYETLSPLYLDEALLGTEYGKVARAVHSIWFQGLSEIGWVGFAAFLMVLYSLYRHLKRAKKILLINHQYRQYYLLIALEGGALGFLISSTFINMFRSQILYWILLFCICASVVMIRTFQTSRKNTGVEKAIDHRRYIGMR